ncbi:MAG: flavodoxin family protein [Nitrospirota bacterium]
MRVLALQGSPRKEGNTELLLHEAVRGAREQGAEVTVYHLNDLNIKPCQQCGDCYETGQCIIQDDIQAIHADIKSCDRIIVASPIFFFSVSAQLKIVIDRCQTFWYQKYIHKKNIPAGAYGRKGLLLLVGGMKQTDSNVGFQCAEAVVRAFFRTVSVPEHVTCTYDNIDEKGAIKDHPTALQEAYEEGSRLCDKK